MWSAFPSILGDDSFSDPQDIIYAYIRDDNLIQLEHLLAASQDVASHLNTITKPSVHRGSAGAWGTPLHFAAWMGDVDAVRMLLDSGADPTIFTLVALGEGYEASALLLAIEAGHRSVVNVLWEFSGPIPADIEEHRAPIQLAYPSHAARAGHAGIVQDLFRWQSWGQNVNRMVLEVAAECWRLHVVDEILRLASYDQNDVNMALYSAVSPRTEYSDEIYPVITPVEYADQQVLIEHLIDAGADSNFCRDGYPPLVVQAVAGGPEFTGALRMLLQKGSNPNASDRDGNTALHVLTRDSPGSGLTAIHWNLTAMRLLLTHNADACLRNNEGVTPLQLAAQYAPDPYDFNFFLDKCISSAETAADFTTESNESLLHFAALGGRRDTMEMLISSHNMGIDMETQTGWTPLMYALLPKRRVNNGPGEGTLHEAIRSARLLLSHGADPLVTTHEGWTPLHALSLHLDRAQDGSAKSLALDLIHLGAPVNPSTPALPLLQKNHAISEHYRKPLDGWQKLPLLHWAAQHGAVDVVKALLECGADAMREDKYGQIAVEVAAKSDFLKESVPCGGPFKEMGSVGKMVMEILDEAGR